MSYGKNGKIPQPHAEPFCNFRHFCGTIIIIVSFFMSHGKNGKNGNICFAPSKAFLSFGYTELKVPSFQWDYYLRF